MATNPTTTTKRLGHGLWSTCEVVAPTTILFLLVRQVWQNLSPQMADILGRGWPVLAVLAYPCLLLLVLLAAAIRMEATDE